jgi:hypothetical protein
MRMISILLAALIAWVPAIARSQTVVPLSLSQVSLATSADATKRVYYVVDLPAVDVPAGYALGEAIISLLVDADNVANDSGSVTLEIYPYTGDARFNVSSWKIDHETNSDCSGTTRKGLRLTLCRNRSATQRLLESSLLIIERERAGAFTAKRCLGFGVQSRARLVL